LDEVATRGQALVFRGAPGIGKSRLLSEDGKLTPELIRPLLRGAHGAHNVQPAVIAISQVTELGTVYTVDEIAALAEVAHAHGSSTRS
jgi:threonine aldolase